MFELLSMLRLRVAVLLSREEGQALAEYALIVAFVAIVAIAFVTILGEDVTKMLKAAGEKI
jgi:Flp pilus assembly pilin Flp